MRVFDIPKLVAQDTAFLGCIDAHRHAGAADAQAIIANGIALLTWGLSVYQREHGAADAAAMLRELEGRVASIQPVKLLEAA